ncbi:MAG: chorismate mutase [Nitrospinota bacterium]
MSPGKVPTELARLRERIRRLDERLVALLVERARLVQEVGRFKARAGLPVRDAAQERAILSRQQRSPHAPLSEEAMRRLYEELFKESRRLEREAMREVGSKGA